MILTRYLKLSKNKRIKKPNNNQNNNKNKFQPIHFKEAYSNLSQR